MIKFSKKTFALLSTGIVLFCMTAILYYHAVDNALTEEDNRYIQMYLSNVELLPEYASYQDELSFIRSVQQSILNIAPNHDEIPPGQKREPKELYEAKTGWSFDKSRVIEKILRYSGFKTRHISIYSTEKTGSALKSLMTPDIYSHAVTEVFTKNGWLVVDPTTSWVSIDTNNQPLSIEYIHTCVKHALPIDWNTEPSIEIYLKPFVFIYGLYSRHGKFYPPYNFIPDIHYGEFIQNVL